MAEDEIRKMKFSDIASVPFEELIKSYPLLEERLHEKIHKVPWVGLYGGRSIHIDVMKEIERKMAEKGFELSGPYNSLWRFDKVPRKDRLEARSHINYLLARIVPEKEKEFWAKVPDSDFQLIVNWLLGRDKNHPELIRASIDFWKDPKHDYMHDGTNFIVDSKYISTYPHDKYYSELKEFGVSQYAVVHRPHWIRMKVAEHYFKLAMEELRNEKNDK